jgi:hypothetical protein
MSTPERELLHDLVNKLTIIQGKVNWVKKGRSDSVELDLEKVDKAVKESIEIIKKLRQIYIEKNGDL